MLKITISESEKGGLYIKVVLIADYFRNAGIGSGVHIVLLLFTLLCLSNQVVGKQNNSCVHSLYVIVPCSLR